MVRNKKSPVREMVTIESWAGEGGGVGRLSDGRVVFVAQGLPGEQVEVEYLKPAGRQVHARLVQVIQPSPERQLPPCRHYGYCGGCQLQNAPYSLQLALKRAHVESIVRQLGTFKAPEVEEVLPSEEVFFYRNKMDFAFAHRRYLLPEELGNPEIKPGPACGFHVAGAFDRVIRVEECLLQHPLHNQIRQAIEKEALAHGFTFYNARTHQGQLRGLILRCNRRGEWMVVLVTSAQCAHVAQKLFNTLIPRFPQVVSWYFIENPKKNDSILDLPAQLWYGQAHLVETIDGLRFRIHPKSFFQTHTAQAEKLYLLAREMAEVGSDHYLLDFYCGAGTTTAVIGQYCRQAVGIDVSPEAIEDAKVSARENGLRHLTFFCGDVETLLKLPALKSFGRPDILVTDPPRAGMTPSLCRQILHLAPHKIVYISCNPATQVRDLNLLSSHYEVVRLKPVDMFPQTRHIECVALLRLRPDAPAPLPSTFAP
ncbi:MAG: 23S rRNA (uracil(1939)-C(5))-methyltransferase RlmD [Flavobacteriales bacterium]|nr:23S rRNA (uracil(1939)-C(5))-methyltransferase RlmD [Flavobacteriales bacterium]MCX7767411.1 23S rRNA (uracil(1939)-C(5))-methyltransferase RlmD [Flavobacteriales bacterium]MDW8410173.1 23S rRNA (uracil(1939)-C(5))-methyltransferase RlmD [Flavobacteriales bacterium]